MKRELEALLFATESPLTVSRLKKIFPDVEASDLKTAIVELQEEYDSNGNAFTVIGFGGGYQISTKPEFSPIVEKMLKTRRFTRLSKAGLEVLAIVAYKQPLTRMEIDDIRGVNSSGAVSTLTERSLVTVVGRSQAVGNPLLYGTTREFLNHLGLNGLGQLPDLPDLENVMDDRDELKEFAAQVGRDLSEEELEEYFAEPEPQDEEEAAAEVDPPEAEEGGLDDGPEDGLQESKDEDLAEVAEVTEIDEETEAVADEKAPEDIPAEQKENAE
ncbi:MAG: segregation and condensation protein B [Candidatus Krumholzibacteriia bacterium]